MKVGGAVQPNKRVGGQPRWAGRGEDEGKSRGVWQEQEGLEESSSSKWRSQVEGQMCHEEILSSGEENNQAHQEQAQWRRTGLDLDRSTQKHEEEEYLQKAN